MSKCYSGKPLKKNRVYSVEDLQNKLGVSANTVSNWVVAGLQPSDAKKPYVLRGACMTAFLKDRRERFAVKLRPGEFKCMGCKSAVFAEINTVEERTVSTGACMAYGCCSMCGAHVRKFISQADRDIFER